MHSFLWLEISHDNSISASPCYGLAFRSLCLHHSDGISRSQTRKRRPKPQHRRRVYLRNPRLHHAQRQANLFHCELFVVVEGQDHSLFLRKFIDRIRQSRLHLPLQATKQRSILWCSGHVSKLFVTRVLRPFHVQTADLKPLQITQQRLILRQCQLHLPGNLLLRRRSSYPLRHCTNRLFDCPSLAPQLSRTPVQSSQRIKNCPTNPELRIAFELHLFLVVKLRESIDQSDHSGGNQVIQLHMLRQPFMDSSCEVTHRRQVLHQKHVPLGCTAATRRRQPLCVERS